MSSRTGTDTTTYSNITLEDGGAFYNYLSTGCRLCRRGVKMVLFVTGTCSHSCFYCPLSEERREDVVLANERPVICDEDVLCEAESMKALGTGITGGEPLLKLEQTLHYIQLLKNHFGAHHHIHLYTARAAPFAVLKKLRQAGLDEIRYHPARDTWSRLHTTAYLTSLINAKSLGMETGIEVPAMPPLQQLIKVANTADVFLNLNELEFSETNAERLHAEGYQICSDTTCAAKGSKELALEASKTCNKIHFCPSAFKDRIQLRRRLQRTAENTARSFEEITSDGTLICGIIQGDINRILKILQRADIPQGWYALTPEGVETSWQILEELETPLKQAGCTLEIIERYPTHDKLIVEKIIL